MRSLFSQLSFVAVILCIAAFTSMTGCSTQPYPGLITRTPTPEEVELVQAAFPDQFSPTEDVFAQELGQEVLYRLVGKARIVMQDSTGRYTPRKVTLLRDRTRGIVTYDPYVYDQSWEGSGFKVEHTQCPRPSFYFYTAEQIALAETE